VCADNENGRCRGATLDISQTRQCLVWSRAKRIHESRRDAGVPLSLQDGFIFATRPGTLCRANVQRRSATAKWGLGNFSHYERRRLSEFEQKVTKETKIGGA
jgi:hypothetical protein